jgi:hypothetical protein
MNKNGYAVAVWVVTDGLTETVQAATSISGINALVGKQITNRSALQTNFINCLEWSASPSPISSYKIYRNGSLLKEVSGFDRHYNDISARRNESYVYSIVGITLDQSETESVSITLP